MTLPKHPLKLKMRNIYMGMQYILSTVVLCLDIDEREKKNAAFE